MSSVSAILRMILLFTFFPWYTLAKEALLMRILAAADEKVQPLEIICWSMIGTFKVLLIIVVSPLID